MARVSADVPGGTQLHLLQQTPHNLLHIFRFHDLLQRTEHFAPQSAPPKPMCVISLTIARHSVEAMSEA